MSSRICFRLGSIGCCVPASQSEWVAYRIAGSTDLHQLTGAHSPPRQMLSSYNLCLFIPVLFNEAPKVVRTCNICTAVSDEQKDHLCYSARQLNWGTMWGTVFSSELFSFSSVTFLCRWRSWSFWVCFQVCLLFWSDLLFSFRVFSLQKKDHLSEAVSTVLSCCPALLCPSLT